LLPFIETLKLENRRIFRTLMAVPICPCVTRTNNHNLRCARLHTVHGAVPQACQHADISVLFGFNSGNFSALVHLVTQYYLKKERKARVSWCVCTTPPAFLTSTISLCSQSGDSVADGPPRPSPPPPITLENNVVPRIQGIRKSRGKQAQLLLAEIIATGL
jgi:hypothetical protein